MRRIYIDSDVPDVVVNRLRQMDYIVINNESIDAFIVVREIAFCDSIVFSSVVDTEGKLGVALGLLKDVYFIGERNRFGLFGHPDIEYVDNWEGLLIKLNNRGE